MKIAVVGTGYVGLVLGACLAETGNDVTCIDKDEAKLRQLRRGVMPIYEPGLEEMVRRNVAEQRLEFTKDLPRAVRSAGIIFIAVGTPQHEDGSADLSHVLAVAKEIARSMNGYKVIVDKSTVPVGTAERVRKVIAAETKHPFSVVSNPEFLKQGAAVEDFLKPDRVVIGVEDDRAKAVMLDLYAPFTRTGAPILMMDCASAEMSKYAANAILATRISFMNEIANICEAYAANVDQVRKAIGSDRRIGQSFLFPGIGFGGSCFPKDIKALIKFAGDRGYEFQTLKAVERVNEAQKVRFITKLEEHFGTLRNRTVAIWGLSFKPRTDDMREAPSIAIIKRLLEARAKVQAYDPQAEPVARRIFGRKIALADKSYGALKGADALVIATEWNEFREPDFNRMRTLMKTPVIFDGRNIYNPETMKAQGFTYYSVGR
jgi:UDPglucose 6-dehydrogenase